MDWSSAIFGAFLACVVISGCTAAVLIPIMRRQFLLWFVLRMIAITVMIVMFVPGPTDLFDLAPQTRQVIGGMATDLGLAFCGPLLASFVEPKVRMPAERRSLRMMLGFILLPLALIPSIAYAGRLDWLHDLTLLALLGVLVRGLYVAIRKGSRSARYQAAAWTPGLIFGTLALLHELIVGGPLNHFLLGMVAVVAFEFVVTAAGVTDSFMILQVERDHALAGMRAAHIANATDPLTNVANRRGLDKHFHQSADDRPNGLALIDCDHFKRINDRFGHDVGDKVLCAVAQGLKGDGVFVARLGGEEFVLLLYGKDWQSMAENARRRISQAVRDQVPGVPFPVTASGGLAGVQDGDTLASAMKRADRALYAAKEAGRNRSLLLTEFRPAGPSVSEVAAG